MAKWQSTLDLAEEWEAAQNKEISTARLAAIVHKKLLELPALGEEYDQKRVEIAEEFECLAADPEVTFDEFNMLWEELYDWADQNIGAQVMPWDQKKVCWVRLF